MQIINTLSNKPFSFAQKKVNDKQKNEPRSCNDSVKHGGFFSVNLRATLSLWFKKN
jgi:hypothetical protein